MRREYLIAMLAVVLSSSLYADEIMGDYKGSFTTKDGTKDAAAQIIAQRKNMYEARIINNFDESGKPYLKLVGQKQGDSVVFSGAFEKGSFKAKASGNKVEISLWSGTIKDGKFHCRLYEIAMDGKVIGKEVSSLSMKKVVRLSPTLGKKPPKNAIVLLGPETKDLSAWQNIRENKRVPPEWVLKEGGILEIPYFKGSLVSKREFKNFKMHLEFKLPLMRAARGQGRANSGVYILGRYEIQVLDSYGMTGWDNECGGIYRAGRPRINMCAPPLQWQTYDLEFTAPKFKDSKKVKDAIITLLHNGVKVHDNKEILACTPGGISEKEADIGPLFLQDHGNPVQFRNIWIVEK